MTQVLAARVFAELADGQFHSGEELAASLGVTRSAIWKSVKVLRDLGVSLEAVRNRGYKLANPFVPLDAGKISGHLGRAVGQKVASLEVYWSVKSTNTTLVSRPEPAAGTCEVLLAEHQSAGRGRRGRNWLAPPGGAICLSMSWTFPQVPHDAGALSLAIGVCVLRALAAHGVQDAQLKWPNDILAKDKKLGGILIELRAEAAGPASAVIGIGLNVALGSELLRKIESLGPPATDLALVGVVPSSRNLLAARVIEACIGGLEEFEREGLRPFVEEWRSADALQGRPVAVQAPERGTKGFARGIDLSGALLVETPGGLQKFYSGDVTLRPTT